MAGREVPSQTIKRLAKMRKAFKILRFVYEAFDVHHKIPKDMNRLIVKMGHMGDALKDHAPGVARGIATAMRPELEKNRLTEIFGSLEGFEPETEEGFWAWENSARATLRNAISAKDISAEELHDVRKTLGRYLNVLNAQHVYDPAEASENMVRFTNKIYGDIGDFHDKLEADKVDELKKAMQESEKLTQNLSDEERRKISRDAKALRIELAPELRTGLSQFLDSLRDHELAP
jgi:CHAD domain-containing protein